jgi:hypothetical protein
MIGQIVVGIEGDWIGTRAGSAQNAGIMLVATVLLVGSWGVNLQGWVAAFAIALFVYGFGAGGEFPTTSTMAMERTVEGPQAAKEDRMHRGRKVQLAFLMQGWGQLFNQTVLIILLLAFHHHGGPPYDAVDVPALVRGDHPVYDLRVRAPRARVPGGTEAPGREAHVRIRLCGAQDGRAALLATLARYSRRVVRDGLYLLRFVLSQILHAERSHIPR